MRYISTLVFIITFSASVFGVSGSKISYKINDKNYEGYFISPGKQAPLVMLIHDWDGLTDYEIKRANMLCKKGYAVFAVDLFGAGVRPTKLEGKRKHTNELYKNRAKMLSLLEGALAQAKNKGAKIDNAVAVGYCFGGAAVLEWARSGADLKGFVTFHGGLKTPEGQDYSKVKGKILIMHGTADYAVPMDLFADLAIELETAGIKHEMITYSGAPHAFTVFGSNRYREDADKKSWKRFLDFLEEVKK